MRGAIAPLVAVLLVAIAVGGVAVFMAFSESIFGYLATQGSKDVSRATVARPEIVYVAVEFNAQNGALALSGILEHISPCDGNVTIVLRNTRGAVVATTTGKLTKYANDCQFVVTVPIGRGTYELEVVTGAGLSATYYPVIVR